MSGIYGDMLLAFPEQMEHSLTVFRMTPRQGGGWSSVANSSITISGIIQNTTGDGIKDANGNLVKVAGMELWTPNAELDEYFMTYGGTTYRLVRSNDWMRQGGFVRYSMEKVVGNNGPEPDNTTWNIGANSF